MLVVLFSGGVDSTVLLTDAVARGLAPLAMWFRYPHPAAASEYRASSEIVRRLGCRWREQSLPLLAEAMNAPKGEPGPRIVPARNLCMVATAINLVASHGGGEIWMGAQGADAEYPDCRPEWVAGVDAMAQAWGVRVRAPLIGLSRSDVIAKGRELGAPLDACSSCYTPGPTGEPCGTCNSCRQ